MTAQPADTVLQVIERPLALAGEKIREAQQDHDRLTRAAERVYEVDPARAGTLRAHASLTDARWVKALGARAALEALYQDMAGRPSPEHTRITEIMQGLGHEPHRVGLEDPHPDTAALLAEIEQEHRMPGGGDT